MHCWEGELVHSSPVGWVRKVRVRKVRLHWLRIEHLAGRTGSEDAV